MVRPKAQERRKQGKGYSYINSKTHIEVVGKSSLVCMAPQAQLLRTSSLLHMGGLGASSSELKDSVWHSN
jgi:hypothetical protein